MKTFRLSNVVLLLVTLLIGLSVCELVTRLITTTNEDGQVFYGQRPLLPYRFPAEMVREKMDFYFQHQEEVYVVDDPLLGWTIGPNRINVEGMYRSNSAGIRSRPYDYSLEPPEGVLRIALFGDSFTHGDEVHFNSTWGKLLEDKLNREGVSAEVLNFGVPGYGIGQAYLRWKYRGKDYSPQIAVFGFQPENIKRAVNIFRSLYSRSTWLVFSKPRFFIDPEGELDLINCPVIPPEEVADTLKNFIDSPLAEYEYWYIPDNYRPSFWLRSRFFALLYTLFSEYQPRPGGRSDYRPGKHYWDAEGEPMRTSELILQKFARDVLAEGQIPIILHIPKKNDIAILEQGTTPAHYRILRELEKEGMPVVDPAPAMVGKSRLFKHSHYSSRGGEIVAGTLAEAIIGLLEEQNLRDSFRGEVSSRVPPDPVEIIMENLEDEEDLLIDLGTAEDKYYIEGRFHQREKHLQRTPVRWTGGTCAVQFPLNFPEGVRAAVSFRIVDSGPPREEIGSVRIQFNEKFLGELPLEGGEKIYRMEIEAQENGPGIARLVFTTPTWQPNAEYGVSDFRELGVMLDWVKLEYY